MSSLRERKRKQTARHYANSDFKQSEKIERSSIYFNLNYLKSKLIFLFGVSLFYYVCTTYTTYLKQLHESNTWFSNLKEVEREISFRTEAGLYYSYFKSLVLFSNLTQAVDYLTRNNDTECWRTINILERFNIYQEVILAAIYKWLNLEKVSY